MRYARSLALILGGQSISFVRFTVFLLLMCSAHLVFFGEAHSAQQSARDDRGSVAHANRLINSNNPYLLLHAHNPVDWYPWGPEALEKAKRENKPIFLSVGYSTCYWCHVAEKTIYALPEFAELMNTRFVNIKVDREQRPDLDRIYMLATQMMTGRGGWPNNVFLTPDLKPFYAGSYFPPYDDSFGRPGFSTILRAIHQTWINEPRRLIETAETVYANLREHQRRNADGVQRTPQPEALLRSAINTISIRADKKHGGLVFGGSTKFPQSPVLEMLLTQYRLRRDTATLNVLTAALDAMAYGGIYDHLGGGFHRYTIEPTWSIPHFEKMLHDNAQLMKIYAEAYALTNVPLYRHVAMEVADYLRRQMFAADGGFYTAEDAEVQGKEGASYVWTKPQIVSALGGSAANRFFTVYATSPMPTPSPAENTDQMALGEEEGVIRVRLPIAQTLERANSGDIVTLLAGLRPLRTRLLEGRKQRPQPLRDEKIIVSLNGMAIEAFVVAGQLLKIPGYVAVAQQAGEKVWATAYSAKTGKLHHEIFRGRVQIDGYLDDYALLGRGFMALHEATRQQVWLDRAEIIGSAMLKHFARPGGMLLTSTSGQDLLIPPVDDGDNAHPSGTSAAVDLLLRLASATKNQNYSKSAAQIVHRLGGRLEAQPFAWGTLISALNTNKFQSLPTGPESAAIPKIRRETAAAFQPPSTATYVKVSAGVSVAADGDQITLTLDIAPGYHINANPASFPYLISTGVMFDGVSPASVAYPKPTLFKPVFAPAGINVYEGTSLLVVKFAKGILRKSKVVKATVTAQACNHEVCLPPSELPITISVNK